MATKLTLLHRALCELYSGDVVGVLKIILVLKCQSSPAYLATSPQWTVLAMFVLALTTGNSKRNWTY